MLETRVIKTQTEYAAAMSEIDILIDLNPRAGTPDADRLELLSVLAQEYERTAFPLDIPDPVTAIRFRMDQQSLSPRDLVPLLGSRSRVSEILSSKRQLTLPMIKALHRGLGIPANALLASREAPSAEETVEWERFPIRELIRRGWLQASRRIKITKLAEELMREYFKPLGHIQPVYARYLKTDNIRSGRSLDKYALMAWTAYVIKQALSAPAAGRYRRDSFTGEVIRELAQLSWVTRGPLLAQEYLGRRGICLVLARQLPGTYLDGAAFLLEDARPVIALTLRHDRIDNFWYALMHELAHVLLHLNTVEEGFYDDLDSGPDRSKKEAEADRYARSSLIPDDVWNRSPASTLRTREAAEHLAQQLKIHPAIVAGRMRYTFRNYRLLNSVVRHGGVRSVFEEAGKA